jgi:hypothetical protein
MRAKTINEVQKFERGIDPKKSMRIGAIPTILIIDGHKESWTPARTVKKLDLYPQEIDNILKNPAKYINDNICIKVIQAKIYEIIYEDFCSGAHSLF